MSKQFWGVIAAIVIIFVGVFALTGNKDESGNSGNGSSSAATSHIKGEGSTGVKLVEYGDFQCPYCQTYHATVNDIVEEYKDRITFQFVNFPLTSIHQNAFAASRAAEAAGKQGKFWEMYDILFQNNDPSGASGWVASNSPTTQFEQFAKQIGLNVEQYNKDFTSKAVNSAVNADMRKGNEAKVDSTPTFFLDGKKVTIGNSAEEFRKALDEAIAKKTENKQ